MKFSFYRLMFFKYLPSKVCDSNKFPNNNKHIFNTPERANASPLITEGTVIFYEEYYGLWLPAFSILNQTIFLYLFFMLSSKNYVPLHY